jgi:Concanavalin A-like lectin/glucanases superfamily
VFIVQKDNAPDSGNSLNWHTPDGLNYLSMNAANANLIVFDSGKNTDFISADISSQPNFYGQWHVITGVRNGLTGEIHLDGQNLATTGSFAGTADIVTPGTLSIGGQRVVVTDQTINGSIAEVKVFGTALTPAQIAAEEASLGSKYGISVVPEPQAYASAFSVLCLVAGLAIKLRRRIA